MSDEWWRTLLDGSVGAALGAAIAVVVVVRSIAAQRKLFFIGQGDLYEQAAIRERKRDAQLDEDRLFAIHEARKSREVEAMGELVASAEALRKDFPQGMDAIKAHLFVMQGAAHRWRLECMDKALYTEIGKWPDFIAFLAIDAWHINERFVSELKDDRGKAKERLGSAFIMTPSDIFAKMNRGDDSAAEALHEQMQVMRSAIGPEVMDSVARLTRASDALKRFTRLYVLSYPDLGTAYLSTVRALREQIGDRRPKKPVMPPPPNFPPRTEVGTE